jgi:hypothetical protein
MKIFMDDFIMYYMDTHLQKLILCFQKCSKYGISLKMCIHGIFRDDNGFYCFQKKETTKSKENTKTSHHLRIHCSFKYLMVWHNFTDVS